MSIFLCKYSSKYQSVCLYVWRMSNVNPYDCPCLYVRLSVRSSDHMNVRPYFHPYVCLHVLWVYLLMSVPKFTANLYCICLSIPKTYTQADAVQICGTFFGRLVFCPCLFKDAWRGSSSRWTWLWNISGPGRHTGGSCRGCLKFFGVIEQKKRKGG